MAVSETRTDLDPLGLPGERRPRADAVRNRARLLQAANELFRERGLDVAVAEIAERAGIGRATLFRNFPTKHDLIVAVVVERMREAAVTGRALLAGGEPHGRLLDSMLSPMAVRHTMDRALFEAIAAEEFFAHPEVQAVQAEILEVIDDLIAADHTAGTVRGDVGAIDVMMLIKGACKVASDFGGEDGERALTRQLTLVRAALCAEAGTACPLPDAPLTLSELGCSAQRA